jgi:TrmH family RNA methyltransferase
MSVLSSRQNPRVRRWIKLARDARLRRKEGRAWIEGPHLVAALRERGMKPVALIVSEEGLKRPEIRSLAGASPVVVSESVFGAIVDAENPPGIAAEISIPKARAVPAGRTVFLEGVQDPSNVGAIIRSAAAFAVGRVVLDRACADPWSPKALRAGMGGHFALAIDLADDLGAELNAFKGRLLCTVPLGGTPIRDADLSGDVGWLFGAEGQGLSEETLRKVPLRVTIPMAAGTESLNVAAAAAICLYEAFSKSGA